MSLPVPEQIQNPKPGSATILEVATPADPTSVQWKRVPLPDTINFQPEDQTATLQSFDAAADYVVKTGFGGTLTFTTAAPVTDEAVKLLLEAGESLLDQAILFYRIKYPDGSYRYGNMVVNRPREITEARGVYRREFTCQLTGPQGWAEAGTP